jgi:hypothetical protein
LIHFFLCAVQRKTLRANVVVVVVAFVVFVVVPSASS